jgi:molybdenum cofactor cytidylyltransferase
MSAQKIVIALLAAGSSRRFGAGNKLLALYRNHPLAWHSAVTLRGITARRHIAICPPDNAALNTLLSRAGFDICINHQPGEGMAASVRIAAQAAIDDGADILLIALADMPDVTEAHYTDLLEGISKAAITASQVDGSDINMPPACFDKAAIPSLLNITGDTGARDLIAKASPVIATAHQLRDFDFAADFEI